MSDFATTLVEARFQEINSRLAARMQEITQLTGVSFSRLFAECTENLEAGKAYGSASLSAANKTEADPALSSATSSDASVRFAQNLINVLSGASLSSLGTDTTYATGKAGNYSDLISQVAQRYGLSPALISAVIRAESNYDPNSVSSQGASGLMQLMPATAMGLGVSNVFDPEQNIDGGVRYLLAQIIRYGGDIKTALAAYNCGPNGLSKRGITDVSDPEQFAKLPQETQLYIQRISTYLTEAGYPNLLGANQFI